MAYEKQKRWRERRVAEGRCERCGQPAAPKRCCVQCRQKKHLRQALQGMVNKGQLKKVMLGWRVAYDLPT